jgi:hypothetical protein
MKEKEMITRMDVDTSSKPSKQCTTCIQVKQHVTPFPKESGTESKNIGDMTYTDVWGPARTTRIHSEQYYTYSFIDGRSQHTVTLFMKKKSEADKKIKQYREYVLMQHGKHCKAFRFDGGGKYICIREIKETIIR